MQLRQAIADGWPQTKHEVTHLIRQYWDMKEELNVVDAVVLRNERMVMPTTMRKEILNKLHTSHQGMVRTKQLAKDLVYWSGTNGEIEEMIVRSVYAKSTGITSTRNLFENQCRCLMPDVDA